MWVQDACLEPFFWHGDIAHCWQPRGHLGECLEACQQEPRRPWLARLGEDY